MKVPLKQLTSWKDGNIGPFLVGVWYVILPFLASQAMNMTMIIFGFTFLAAALVRAKSKPSVLGSLAAAFLGVTYFMFVMTAVPQAALWAIAVLLFALVAIFELEVFKFGPSTSKGKELTVVPFTILGFAILIGLAGYNPVIHFNWASFSLIGVSYLAMAAFCFLYVFDMIGYRPLRRNTVSLMNLTCIAVIALSMLGIYQGSLFQW